MDVAFLLGAFFASLTNWVSWVVGICVGGSLWRYWWNPVVALVVASVVVELFFAAPMREQLVIPEPTLMQHFVRGLGAATIAFIVTCIAKMAAKKKLEAQ
jgi:chromate transport protein ChrA